MQRFRPILNLIVIWTIIALVFTTINYLSGRSEGRNSNFWIILLDNFFRFGVWGFLSPVIFWLSSRFDFSTKAHYLRDFSAHIFGAVTIISLHFLIYGLLAWFGYIRYREESGTYWQFARNTFLGFFYLGLLVYGLIIFACQAMIRNRRFANEQKKSAALQAQLVQAQLQALKMQLQPHFLFNTLNSISSLVIKNPLQAQTMIAKLGDFLRMTLDFNENQMVLLKEELQFLRSYLDIEQTRFSEKLQVVFDVNENVLNAVVPHLAMQPIVENSVKHGISQLTEGGKIEIIANKIEDKLQLQVKDNGKGKENFQPTEKTGLSNIKSRLQHLYGKEFSFEMKRENGIGTIVTLMIPLSFEFANIEKND